MSEEKDLPLMNFSRSITGRGKWKVEIELTDACILYTEMEHKEFQGGDCGHGCFVRITFKSEAGAAIFLDGEQREGFTFEFCGDAERRTLTTALELLVKELKAQQ